MEQNSGTACKLTLQEVHLFDENWEFFVRASVDYIEENWGLETTRDVFEKQYSMLLQQRIAEGGRLLFLLRSDDCCCGFVNAYIEKCSVDQHDTLFIAEFCVFEEFRRHGFGREILRLLLSLPAVSAVAIVSAEADKNRAVANAFWSRVMQECRDSGACNLYFRRL
jgi:predicted acetyltransferase